VSSQLELFEGASEKKLTGRERRVDYRYEACWPIRCLFGGTTWDATVVDASAGGLGIDCNLPLSTGTIITAELPGIGTYKCRVAWKYETRCGLQFMPSSDDMPDGALNALAASISSI
jgi:hypothetical protein